LELTNETTGYWNSGKPCSGFFSILQLKKIPGMKAAGWILIVIGIVMILIKGFSIPVEKKVIDVGPIQVSKTENKWIGWPTYAGGVLAVTGIVLVVTSRKK
jgi:hypothetical protein